MGWRLQKRWRGRRNRKGLLTAGTGEGLSRGGIGGGELFVTSRTADGGRHERWTPGGMRPPAGCAESRVTHQRAGRGGCTGRRSPSGDWNIRERETQGSIRSASPETDGLPCPAGPGERER